MKCIKIQSMVDVITNSSTSVFIVYSEKNITDIKNLVNALLAIDSKYTFDDLFEIELCLNYDLINYASEELSDDFKELKDSHWKVETVDAYSKEKLDKLVSELWNYIYEHNYYSGYKSPYECISITAKENSPEVLKATTLLNQIDSIFDIDYSED